MTENHSNLVTRVWNYAHVLRRQGVPFGDYIEQITYLLFLKMDEERDEERELLGETSSIPDVYRWHCLRALDGDVKGSMALDPRERMHGDRARLTHRGSPVDLRSS